MKQIEQTYEIKAPIAKVWSALVDPKVIAGWGGGPATMSAVADSEFSLWGGDIHGINTRVIEVRLLEQDWYSGDWKNPSKVGFYLNTDGDKTVVRLIQTDIPDNDVKDIATGWSVYYLGPLKELLENN
jgi:uncharacterized protein YndB with AHSA1/START domain